MTPNEAEKVVPNKPLAGDARRLWTEAFPNDSAEWLDSFFTRICSDDTLLGLRSDGRLASMLLMLPYEMHFHGAMLPTAYICGVATQRKLRGRGLMGRLMRSSLAQASERGFGIATLIPADSRLELYYRRFGFKPTFPVIIERYTALHPFPPEPGDPPFYSIENVYDEGVARAFRALEMSRPCRIIHTERQYRDALDDLRLDGGSLAVMADEAGAVSAFAWAVVRNNGGAGQAIVVRDLLATSPAAARAALAELRRRLPGLPFSVTLPVDDSLDALRCRSPRMCGMARIVNAEACLHPIAAAHPKLALTLRVSDPLIAENNATFHIHGGIVERVMGALRSKPDLDVDISTLTTLIFASPAAGEVIGLPSVRPELALMLD